jgi:RimJ/RimL family protein N-acetyltransferase
MRDPFFAPESFRKGEFELRIYRPGDGAELLAATKSSYEHLRPWMPWATTEETVEITEQRVRRFAAEYLRNEEFVIGAWIGDELVGGTGFHLRCGPLAWSVAEIGMWIRGSRANQGTGTRVLQAMLEWGFTEWGWERLIWKCDTRNIGSARVAEKGGMTREAAFRSCALDVDGNRCDMWQYAILREEWEASCGMR